MAKHADKRSVSTDALETLGMIIDENQARDAIHLAVDPAIAGQKLYPGQDVGLVNGEAVICDKPLGIVDPFLKGPVHPGQRFWLVVYPRQITSLRHVWSHPSFPEAEIAATQRPNKAVSEQWLKDFCKNNDAPTYEDAVALALRGSEWGDEYLTVMGYDAHCPIPPEFYDHLEIVTGKKVPPEKRATYFSCSC